MIIACVYKTGGEFTGEYVDRLYQVLKYTSLNSTHISFMCMTDADDVPEYIPTSPLICGFPGFWSKMELFTLEDDDILYFDLDTVFRFPDIRKMVEVCQSQDKMIMLSDFYFPEKLQSGVMYIPRKGYYETLWGEFSQNWSSIIKEFKGDGEYIDHLVRKHGLEVERWDEILPDYIASYKANVTGNYPKHLNPLQVDVEQANVICYHGLPRPHETNWVSGL